MIRYFQELVLEHIKSDELITILVPSMQLHVFWQGRFLNKSAAYVLNDGILIKSPKFTE